MTAEGRYERFMEDLGARNAGEEEFLQAVEEVARDVAPLAAAREECREAAILERLAEPDRAISFRVVWEDDAGRVRVNRGWRIQFNNAIGPYKGGLRLSPGVSASVLKFLGFEQTFKNALTGLPMGGAKGGADLDPACCSPREIMRFCQAFMTELHRHIGPDVDVPAGDMNVGMREIGWLFGAYKRITGEFQGSITGKSVAYGGSPVRMEATGHGLVHFVEEMLARDGAGLEGRRVAVSGAGNVATHAAERAARRGAVVVALSDSRGTLHKPDGFAPEDVAAVRAHKSSPGTRLSDCADALDARWLDGAKPWRLAPDVALPCATENELDAQDARALAEGGLMLLAEGANMPATAEALDILREARVLYGPAKAANAGGVAVSGLEVSQNVTRLPRSAEDLQETLRRIMSDIHATCADAAERHGHVRDGRIDYARGANLAAFEKLADAMLAQGLS